LGHTKDFKTGAAFLAQCSASNSYHLLDGKVNCQWIIHQR